MSLALALSCMDGIVVGVDSRGTIGDPRSLTAINDTQQKLFRIHDRACIAIVGTSEIGQSLIERCRSQISEDTDCPLDRIKDEIIKCSIETMAEWFGHPQPVVPFPGGTIGVWPPLTMILAGTEVDGTPKKWALVSQTRFAPMLFPPNNCCMAGVVNYAVYLANRLYNPSIKISNGARLVEYLIFETATQDPKVGGPIRIVTIGKDEGYKEFTEEEIKEIRKLNARQSGQLKDFFFNETTMQDTQTGGSS